MGRRAANVGRPREGKGAEVFDLQDRITQQIVTGVAPNIRASELQAALRKRPESLTAYDRMLRGVHLIYAVDRRTSEQARQYLEEAMLEDPTFALPAAYASWWHCLAVGQGWSKDPEAETERAFGLASRAIALEPSNALALSAKGHLLSYLRREYDAALLFFARALEACPNHAFSWMLSSMTRSFVGRAEEALARAARARAVAPGSEPLPLPRPSRDRALRRRQHAGGRPLGASPPRRESRLHRQLAVSYLGHLPILAAFADRYSR